MRPDCAAQGISGLFPDKVVKNDVNSRLDSALRLLNERIEAAPVYPRFDLDRFRCELAGFTFEQERSLTETLDWIIAQMERGIVQITHPRYFGLFNPAPSFPAQCADRIVAAFNPQLASATTSPVPVAIEAHVIGAMAARAGLPPGAGGHFTTGGSEANFTALVCALTKAEPGFRQAGTRCFRGAPRIYVSQDAHLAWIKIAQQAGIGRDGVRMIATDGHGALDAGALAEAVDRDRAAGDVGVMIAATAGTTAAGMIDPLDACASTARATSQWFHVDAAWGGAVLASSNHCALLAGIACADSITIDAHKWFSTTMGCGIFLARCKDDLAAAFQVATDFMPPGVASEDPYATTVQWSRRFLGLRLFTSLAAVGWAGHGAHIDRAIALAGVLRTKLSALGWKVVNASPLAVLCLVPPYGAPPPDVLVQRVSEAGRVWVSHTRFEGRPVIRACITNGRSTVADIEALVGELERARAGGDARVSHDNVIRSPVSML